MNPIILNNQHYFHRWSNMTLELLREVYVFSEWKKTICTLQVHGHTSSFQLLWNDNSEQHPQRWWCCWFNNEPSSPHHCTATTLGHLNITSLSSQLPTPLPVPGIYKNWQQHISSSVIPPGGFLPTHPLIYVLPRSLHSFVELSSTTRTNTRTHTYTYTHTHSTNRLAHLKASVPSFENYFPLENTAIIVYMHNILINNF